MIITERKHSAVEKVVSTAPWPIVRLRDVTTKIGSGATPRGGDSVYKTVGVPLIRSMNVHFGGFKPEGLAYIDEIEADKLDHVKVYARDVLLNITGASIGRVTTAPDEMQGARVNQHVCIIRPVDRLDPKFLAHFLASPEQQSRVMRIQVGATRQALTKAMVENWEVPVPPLDEQRRIVAEIEKQFTRLDAGVAALRRTQTNLKRYRAAVLKAACEGRLVPTEAELARSKPCIPGSISRAGATTTVHGSTPVGSSVDPGSTPGTRNSGKHPGAEHVLHTHGFTETADCETGEQLLQHILAERRKNWPGRGKYKEPLASDESLPMPHVPAGWVIASIGQLAAHITSGSRDWSRFYGRGSGTFILAQNVRPMRLDMSERQAVDAPEDDAETERTLVRQNDLLVTIVGAKTGDVCRVRDQLSEHYVCQSVALVRPVHAGTARFLELWLASQENGQALWKEYVYGQGRPHLSFEQIKATPVFLPPLVEQTRIVAEVERRLSVIDELEAVVTANLARAHRLKQSILRRSFGK